MSCRFIFQCLQHLRILIYRQLFVPAGRIYCLTDNIHFHIQLTGLRCSLYTLFSGTDLDRVTPVNSATKNEPKNKKKPLICVTLLRQVSVMIQGESARNNSILGEGTIWPIPPDISSCGDTTCPPSQCRSEGHIDWDGEVRCRSDITVGGFNAANVQVKVGFSMSLQNDILIFHSNSVGFYYSIHLATYTNISLTGAEPQYSREIGYRLFLGYYYADGFCCPMIQNAPFNFITLFGQCFFLN